MSSITADDLIDARDPIAQARLLPRRGAWIATCRRRYADGLSSTRIHPELQELHVGDKVPYSRLKSVLVMAVDWPHYVIAGPWLVHEGAQGNLQQTAATSE